MFAYAQGDPQQTLALTVPAGVPLRLYLTRRVPKRAGAPVQAKLLAPVYAFDRQVIPAGTEVLGRVSRLEAVSKSQRTRAVLGGDFTPLHVAQFEFTSLLLPDGRRMPLDTVETPGLNSVVPLKPPKKKDQNIQNTTGGVLGTGKQRVEDQIHAQIARAKSIPDIVRGPDKRQRLYDFLMSKLPYHPQAVRSGTRFDAELRAPLSFGTEAVRAGWLELLGTQPPPTSTVHARLITPLDSGSSKQGQTVEAVLSEPVFSPDLKLILPAGTRVLGSVVVAKKSRWFHRGGQLRFNFQSVELPPEVAQLRSSAPSATALPGQRELHFRTQATLKAAESDKAPLKVDKEGGVSAKESKTRFIGTVVAVMIARRAADNDPERAKGGAITGQNPNVGGRTLGGGFGFGLLGALASQSSRYVGTAFGYYGMAWSVYSTVIARGAEVQFGRNAVIDIGFNARTPDGVSKF